MTRKSEERSIQGHTYKVTALDARAGVRLLQKLGGVLAGYATGGASIATQFGAAMRGLDDVSEVVDVLSTQAWVDGRALEKTWTEHFSGRYGALVEYTIFALEVNFGTFLSELEALMQRYAPASGGQESDSKV